MYGSGRCIRRAVGEVAAALADRGVVGGVMTNRWMRMTCDCEISLPRERRTEGVLATSGGVDGTVTGGDGRPAARMSSAATMARTREAADGDVATAGDAGACAVPVAASATEDACPTRRAAGEAAAVFTLLAAGKDSDEIASGVKGVPTVSLAPPPSGRQRSGSSGGDVGTGVGGRPYTTAASCRAMAAGMTLICLRRRRRGGAAVAVATPLRTTSVGAAVAGTSALWLRGTRPALARVGRGGSASG